MSTGRPELMEKNLCIAAFSPEGKCSILTYNLNMSVPFLEQAKAREALLSMYKEHGYKVFYVRHYGNC